MAAALAGARGVAIILGANAGTAAVATAITPSTSPLVTRPSRPVPATEPLANWLSAISLAAAGMATPAIEAAGAASATGAAADAAAGATSPARASVSIRAIS